MNDPPARKSMVYCWWKNAVSSGLAAENFVAPARKFATRE
jgi:hypothetical protein